MGGALGVMTSPNCVTSQFGTDGLYRSRRSVIGGYSTFGNVGKSNYACVGVSGLLHAIDEGSPQTISAALNETSSSGATITLIGDISRWPTSGILFKIDDEIIYAKSRSGQILTLPSTGSPDFNSTAGRGNYGTLQKSHLIGSVAYLLSSVTDTVWLSWQHGWLKAGTLNANINNSDITIVLDSADVDGWIIGSHVIRIGSEFISVSRTAGSANLSVSQRGYWSSSAASHTAGDRICLTDWNLYGVPILWASHDINNMGPIRFALTLENPEGATVTGANFRMGVFPAQNEGMIANPSFDTAIYESNDINPTWSDSAGTLGGYSVLAPSNNASLRVQRGMAGIINGNKAASGPISINWMCLRSGSRPGGGIQTFETSAGGKRLIEWIWGILQTPDAPAATIRKFQSMRWFASNANNGNGLVRLVFDLDFGSNDLAETHLSFATAGQTWTRQYSKTLDGDITDLDTSIVLSNVTNIPTSGHFLIPSTGERCIYNGISGNTLQNVLRGQFITSADIASSGDEIWFGWPCRDPLGMPSLVKFCIDTISNLWNLADISTTNFTYPFAEGASFPITALETGTPSAATECLFRWIRPPTRWDTPTSPVSGDTISTAEDCEGRLSQWVSNMSTYVVPLHSNYETVDFGSTIITADELAANYSDVNSSTTLNGAISNTSSTSVTVTSTSGWNQQGYLLVNGECMRRSSYSGNVCTVVRGVGGTTASTHSNGATVVDIDTIHQTYAGFEECWQRWASKNLMGSLGVGAVKYANAGLAAATRW